MRNELNFAQIRAIARWTFDCVPHEKVDMLDGRRSQLALLLRELPSIVEAAKNPRSWANASRPWVTHFDQTPWFWLEIASEAIANALYGMTELTALCVRHCCDGAPRGFGRLIDRHGRPGGRMAWLFVGQGDSNYRRMRAIRSEWTHFARPRVIGSEDALIIDFGRDPRREFGDPEAGRPERFSPEELVAWAEGMVAWLDDLLATLFIDKVVPQLDPEHEYTEIAYTEDGTPAVAEDGSLEGVHPDNARARLAAVRRRFVRPESARREEAPRPRVLVKRRSEVSEAEECALSSANPSVPVHSNQTPSPAARSSARRAVTAMASTGGRNAFRRARLAAITAAAAVPWIPALRRLPDPTLRPDPARSRRAAPTPRRPSAPAESDRPAAVPASRSRLGRAGRGRRAWAGCPRRHRSRHIRAGWTRPPEADELPGVVMSRADAINDRLRGVEWMVQLELQYDLPDYQMRLSMILTDGPEDASRGVKLTAKDVARLKLDGAGGGFTQLCCLQVADVRAWQHDRVAFEVREYEHETLYFVCSDIEVSTIDPWQSSRSSQSAASGPCGGIE